MALTDTQKAKIRLYLGYPDGFRYRHTRLESVLDNVSPEAEILLAELLTSLVAVETAVTSGASSSSLSIQMAGLKRVDEIEFYGNQTTTSSGSTTNTGFKSLKEAGRYYAGRISVILGVPFNANVFGGSGYPGDEFFPGFGTPINLG